MNEKEKQTHPSVFEFRTLFLSLILAFLGAVIGLELITRLGISTNTSIIGALVAILVSRIPLAFLRKYSDIYRQNLLQTTISGATFGAANALLLPIGIPWLLGRFDLVIPMFIGAVLGTLMDVTMLYWLFDTRVFPAKHPWPPGIATAETIFAAAKGGKRARYLVYGGVAGAGLRYFFKIPADILGVSWIGNIWALTMFGIGLLVRGYFPKTIGIDINQYYVPHGVMIGAGLVALIQIVIIVTRTKSVTESQYTRSEKIVGQALGRGFVLYLVIALIIALIGALFTNMTGGKLILWIVFAAAAALVSELIVGLSAMHAGWFPAFATALIFLVLGMLLGFPPAALALLVGFTASTGPAFADMGYDLKAGWLIRGEGKDKALEMAGRKQQYFAELIGLVVAAIVVFIVYKNYFNKDLFPPVDRVYVSTIQAGASPVIKKYLLLWAIPGAIVQAIGGPARQLGILFATGLLINYPIAGITVIAGIVVRLIIIRIFKEEGQNTLYVLGAGLIAGSTLVSFFTSTLSLGKKK